MGVCESRADISDDSSDDSFDDGAGSEGTGGAFSQMGVELLRLITSSDRAANAFISPLSIGLALAMTANGARGGTLDGMMAALGAQNLGGIGALNADVPTLISAFMSKDPRVTFHLANSVWSQTFLATFVGMCRNTFHAEARCQVPLPGPINEWCRDHTRGKITQVLDPVTPLDPKGLVLVNALYFKGAWKAKFDEHSTLNVEFRSTSGSTSCKMMAAKGEGDGKNRFLYMETNAYQVACLPYGDNGEYSAVLVLPRDSDAETLVLHGRGGGKKGKKPPEGAARAPRAALVDDVLLAMVSDWPSLFGRLTMTKGTLKFPRFKVEFEVQLRRHLEARGMADAFTDHADFGNMSAVKLKISKVIHKTFVEVNEEGTEAAAVTAVVMAKCVSAKIKPPEPFFTMVCDRPFLFFIRHNPTNAMVFAGSVVNPG